MDSRRSVNSTVRQFRVMPAIYEDFKDYKPPITIHRTIDKLLGALPERYLSGLRSIILTDSASIGHGKTSRVGGRKLDASGAVET
jgi:hypothetical protein